VIFFSPFPWCPIASPVLPLSLRSLLSTADSVAGAAPPLIRRSLGAYDLALVTAFMML
jgi:hypothetical protein